MNHPGCGIARACLALILATCVLLSGCARPAPEQALRETVDALQGSIEQRDASGLSDVLAGDFIGPEGMNRDGARRTALLLFRRYRDVGVNLGPLDIDMKQAHATVRFTAALTGGAGVLPESGQMYDVETGWRREGDEWQLVSAVWRPTLRNR
jgi:hypothetical protein